MSRYRIVNGVLVVGTPRCLLCRRQLKRKNAAVLVCQPRCRGPALRGPDYELQELAELAVSPQKEIEN
jgi:hypothetical protein